MRKNHKTEEREIMEAESAIKIGEVAGEESPGGASKQATGKVNATATKRERGRRSRRGPSHDTPTGGKGKPSETPQPSLPIVTSGLRERVNASAEPATPEADASPSSAASGLGLTLKQK